MEKQKRWQFYLILAVIVLTVYNILPTVFFYAKPLKSPIDEKRSFVIAEQIMDRVNALEPQAKEWLDSFCSLLNIKPAAITFNPSQPQFVNITFASVDDANIFRQYLPRSGALIPFVPAQLTLYDAHDTVNKSVIVQRRIPIHFDGKNLNQYAEFSKKYDINHNPTSLYRALVEDRAMQVGVAFGGASESFSLRELRGFSSRSEPST